MINRFSFRPGSDQLCLRSCVETSYDQDVKDAQLQQKNEGISVSVSTMQFREVLSLQLSSNLFVPEHK